MRMRGFMTLLGVALLAMLVGCGGDPPLTELSAARQILDEARNAGAERYAPSEFAAAQGAYAQAENTVNTEKEKLFKNFDEARTLIADARARAESARSATVAAKQRARASAEDLVAQAGAAIDQARTDLDAAPSGKGTEGDVEQLRLDLNGADADLSAARAAVASENFDQATARASSAKQKAEQVANGVQMAVQRYAELVQKNTPWYERF